MNLKNLIATIFVATLLSSCGGGKSEICNCADMALKMIKEAKEANGDQEKMMEGIQATMGDNPEQAMTDAIALESMGKETEKCISSLEKKYDKIYTTDKDEVVQQKLLNALEKSADCKFTYAILKIGMNSKE